MHPPVQRRYLTSSVSPELAGTDTVDAGFAKMTVGSYASKSKPSTSSQVNHTVEPSSSSFLSPILPPLLFPRLSSCSTIRRGLKSPSRESFSRYSVGMSRNWTSVGLATAVDAKLRASTWVWFMTAVELFCLVCSSLVCVLICSSMILTKTLVIEPMSRKGTRY